MTNDAYDRWTRALNQLRADADTVLGGIAMKALNIWESAGCVEDFCVQSMSDVIVFGGTNRVVWLPESGLHLSVSHCTANFITAWNRLYPTRAVEIPKEKL